MATEERDREADEELPAASDDTEPRGGVPQARFPIVGIGASAGGLDALRTLFTAMPADTGMGFVLTQHLDAEHQSLLAELLSKYTRMPVVQVESGMTVEPDHIYVIPPNTYMTISDGVLLLKPPSDARGMRMPIDRFLYSLAADRQDQAIGIIVSGSGTDGTLGLREIKARGGMVMVQDPETAQYDGMPRSAIATGLVDVALPLERMPKVLLNSVRHAYVEPVTAPARPGPEVGYDPLAGIFSLLLAKTGHDFRRYKKGTLVRRINRRMGITGMERFEDYLTLLRERDEEVRALAKDMFIGVTSFFREAEAWDSIAELAIAPIVAGHTGEGQVRIWVPGCATGEEPYTLAILFAEAFERAKKNLSLLIFATDVDQEALQTARAGLYLENIAETLTPERLNLYFTKEGDGYRVKKWLRDLVAFTPQNLIADPPFSKLDLISCRNLLIYLEPRLQDKILRLFHFALEPGGFLVLGSSETLGAHQQEFRTLSKKWRIFQPEGPIQLGPIEMPLAREALGSIPRLLARGPGRREPSLADMSQQALVETFAPASVLATRRYQVLYVYGDTSDYLAHPPGELTDDLIAMTRPELRLKTRAALHQAIGENRQVSLRGAQLQRGEAVLSVSVTVTPLQKPPLVAGLLLVSFQLEPLSSREPGEARQGAGAEAEVVRQLEDELKTTREELQSTIEELETSNEELKASNEEVMSMNEELQSSNEELETSKEELQSLNEELITVNNQLQNKVAEVEAANNDLANLLASSNIATLFLDRNFRIKRFTPATTRLMNLIPADMGRPVADIAHKYANDNLLMDCQRVMDELRPVEREVLSETGAWYIRRVQPYRTQDNRIEGTVVTFTDVTALKGREEEHARLAGIVESSLDAIVSMTPEGIVTTWNPGAEAIQGYRAEEVLGRSIQSLAPAHRKEEWAHALQEAAAGRRMGGFESELQRRDGSLVQVWATLCPIRNATGEAIAASAICRDITEQAKAEQALREQGQRLSGLIDSAMDAVISLDDEQRIVLFNPAAERMFGLTASEACGQDVGRLIPERLRKTHAEHIRAFGRTGDTGRRMGALGTLTGLRANGEEFPIEASISQIRVGGQRLFTAILRDIAERVMTEEALRKSEAQLRSFVEQAPIGIAMLDRDLNYLAVSHRWIREYGRGHTELIGRNHYEILLDLPDEWKQVLRQALAGETLKNDEDLWVQADGSRHWLRWAVQPWTNGHGAIGGIIIAAEDITDRKLAEESLRESEARLRAVMEALPLGLAVVDAQGGVVHHNRAYDEIWGDPLPATNSIEDYRAYQAWWLDTGLPVRPEEWASARAVRQGETVIGQLIRIRRFDGSTAYVRNSGAPIHDAIGRISGGVVAILDITDQILTQEALRASQADLNRAQAVGRIGSWRIDVRKNLLTWSPENHRLFGIPEGTPMSYETFLSVVHPQDREYVDRKWHACLRGEPYDIEHRLMVGGQIKWVGEQAELEFDEDGQLKGGFGTTQDITERKRVEEALQTADRRKDEFLAILGHELRNPLMPIRNALEVLASDPGTLPEKVQWALDLIGRQVAHLERLVGDLLDVARITHGRMRLLKRPIDLREALRDAVETTASLLEQHRHHLDIRLPDAPVVVEADPLRLAQVCANLLSNAAKYTPDGGQIRVSLAQEGQAALVRVKDNGVGIPSETLPRLFDFFTRGDKEGLRNVDPGGLGLGLALARRLVERHDGTLQAFSDGPGQGSEFVVSLPISARDEEPSTQVPTRGLIAQRAHRVLVVDDNPDVAASLKVLMETLGHQVRVLSRGSEVAGMVQQWQPEAVFLDIAMPDMDGYAVAAAIRATCPEPCPRLFALTGYGQESDRERALAAGFDRHLLKPLAAAELADLLEGLP